MWTRKELKEKGRSRFQANYWKGVLVALILTIVLGGSGGSGGGNSYNGAKNSVNNIKQEVNYDNGNSASHNEAQKEIGEATNEVDEVIKGIKDQMGPEVVAAMAAFSVIIFIVLFIVLAIAICMDVFLFNPLEVSCQNYFVTNLDEDAPLNTLSVGFSKSYKNIVDVMFFRDLFTVLWTLLLIVPGVIKSYEYRMIPYLLTENPDLSREEAFEISKKMMMGNKWDAFVLDLSFIGWGILNALTCGILGIFFVNPYKYQTNAALYDALVQHNDDTTPTEYAQYVEV